MVAEATTEATAAAAATEAAEGEISVGGADGAILAAEEAAAAGEAVCALTSLSPCAATLD